MYQSGKNGRRDEYVKNRIAPYEEALAKELGKEAKVSGSWSGMHIDATDRSNWEKMAQWLEDRRAFYERVLLKGTTRATD
ncbi:MAG: hypothetical protein J4G00_04480 [Actinomycetia bacterium]|nr:hypothetical protein [Actinomycetes bacterium]